MAQGEGAAGTPCPSSICLPTHLSFPSSAIDCLPYGLRARGLERPPHGLQGWTLAGQQGALSAGAGQGGLAIIARVSLHGWAWS